jgi:hypothetical protein
MEMLLVSLGIAALFGAPVLVAAITMLATWRGITRIRHVVLLTLWLILLVAWQLMPVVYLAGLQQATAGEGFFYLAVCGGLCMLALVGWNAGRLTCRLAREARTPAPFDAARSAAVMALLYGLAFGAFAWTRDTRWMDWVKDWPPAWVSIPVTLAISIGLWRRMPIAAWIGIAFAVFTLLWLFNEPAFAKRFVRMDRVFLSEPLGPLLAWLFALLLPGARRGCEPLA